MFAGSKFTPTLGRAMARIGVVAAAVGLALLVRQGDEPVGWAFAARSPLSQQPLRAALATPREWIKRPRSLEIGDFTNNSNEPLCVYSDGAFVDSHTAMWSDYYRSNPRTPEDVELMPHAREFVRRRWGSDRLREKSSAPLPGATGKIK